MRITAAGTVGEFHPVPFWEVVNGHFFKHPRVADSSVGGATI